MTGAAAPPAPARRAPKVARASLLLLAVALFSRRGDGGGGADGPGLSFAGPPSRARGVRRLGRANLVAVADGADAGKAAAQVTAGAVDTNGKGRTYRKRSERYIEALAEKVRRSLKLDRPVTEQEVEYRTEELKNMPQELWVAHVTLRGLKGKPTAVGPPRATELKAKNEAARVAMDTPAIGILLGKGTMESELEILKSDMGRLRRRFDEFETQVLRIKEKKRKEFTRNTFSEEELAQRKPMAEYVVGEELLGTVKSVQWNEKAKRQQGAAKPIMGAFLDVGGHYMAFLPIKESRDGFPNGRNMWPGEQIKVRVLRVEEDPTIDGGAKVYVTARSGDLDRPEPRRSDEGGRTTLRITDMDSDAIKKLDPDAWYDATVGTRFVFARRDSALNYVIVTCPGQGPNGEDLYGNLYINRFTQGFFDEARPGGKTKVRIIVSETSKPRFTMLDQASAALQDTFWKNFLASGFRPKEPKENADASKTDGAVASAEDN